MTLWLPRLDMTTFAAGSVQADITGASAQVSSAQADLQLLLAGAKSESIAAAEASVAAAAAALSDAEAALADMTLKAPFAGTVAAVNVEVGEQVALARHRDAWPTYPVGALRPMI